MANKYEISYICPTKPNKDGVGLTKKGATIKILEVNEIPPSE